MYLRQWGGCATCGLQGDECSCQEPRQKSERQLRQKSERQLRQKSERQLRQKSEKAKRTAIEEFRLMPATKQIPISKVSVSRQSGSMPVDSIQRTLIGTGSFGYVLRPALPCVNSERDPTGGVSKIMKRDKAQEEYLRYASLDLDELDPERRYSVGEPTLCKLERDWYSGLQRPQGGESPVRNYDYNVETGPKFDVMADTVLNYENGGDTVHDLLMRAHRSSDPSMAKDIMRSLLNLWEGLAEYHKHHLYHLDIKSLNVVGTVKGLRFIDFGVSVRYEKPTTGHTPYIYWPPEFGISEYMPLTTTAYNTYIHQVYDSGYGMRYRDYLPLATRSNNAILEGLRKRPGWLAGVDIWAMGILMLDVYFIVKTLIPTEAAALVPLIRRALHPGVRPSASDMVSRYRQMLIDNLDHLDYLDSAGYV